MNLFLMLNYYLPLSMGKCIIYEHIDIIFIDKVV